MISSAFKLSVDQIDYRGHAWVDNDPRGAFVMGMYYMPRPYQIGDVICLNDRNVIVSEIFDGFDFHSLEPTRYFQTKTLCSNCHQAAEEYFGHRKYNWSDFTCDKDIFVEFWNMSKPEGAIRAN